MSKPEYPYEWTLESKPEGYKGKRCRLVGSGKTDIRLHKGQGIVRVEFKTGAIFDVVKKGLKKVA